MSIVSISTVTPVYNGSKYLNDLVTALLNLREEFESSYPDIKLAESIFVLDEPIDSSEQVINKLAEEHDWITVLSLSSNFGQHPATIAGVLHSSGDWVVTLDEDLQHHPSKIFHLLKKACDESSDIIYANPLKSTHKSFVKDFLARSFKKLMSRMLANKNIRYFNSYRLMRGDIARAAAAISRHETYYDIALSWFTKRVDFIKMNLVDQRNVENVTESGYSFWGLIKHAKRMFMSSKVKLFRWGIPLGVIAFFVSVGLGVYALGATFLKFETILNKGWTSTILAVIFFGGISTLLAGFILETVSEVLLSVNGKPTFFVINRSKDEVVKRSLQNLANDHSQEL